MKITEQQLRGGLKMAQDASMYPQSINCLWGKREDIPEDNYLKPIVGFRKFFESDSPLFFSKFLELSESERIVHNFYGLQIEGGTREQMHEAQTEFHDLHIFAQTSLLTLYPLFLMNNGEFPILSSEEIREESRNFSSLQPGQIDPTGRKMYGINRDWLDWIMRISGNLVQPQKYIKAISLLVRLFIKGLEKTQLPCFSEMTEFEKQGFFQELEGIISQKNG